MADDRLQVVAVPKARRLAKATREGTGHDRRRVRPHGVGRPSALVAGELPGGFGKTPGFIYRDYLEAVIGHGSPPTSLLRRILFDGDLP